MGIMDGLGGLISVLIWTLGNLAYWTFRSAGETGFKRIVAFWMGMPLTWVTLLAVREGIPMDDGDGLVGQEVRELRAAIARDRVARIKAARSGLPRASDPADSGESGPDARGWEPLER